MEEPKNPLIFESWLDRIRAGTTYTPHIPRIEIKEPTEKDLADFAIPKITLPDLSVSMDRFAKSVSKASTDLTDAMIAAMRYAEASLPQFRLTMVDAVNAKGSNVVIEFKLHTVDAPYFLGMSAKLEYGTFTGIKEGYNIAVPCTYTDLLGTISMALTEAFHWLNLPDNIIVIIDKEELGRTLTGNNPKEVANELTALLVAHDSLFNLKRILKIETKL